MAAPTVPPLPPLPDPEQPWLSYPAGVYPPPPLRPVSSNNSGGVGAVLTLVGGGLVALGSLLPWITAIDNYGHTADFSGMAAGTRGDGPYVLGFGVIALCFGVARLASSIRPGLQRVPALFGVFAGWAAVIDLNGISQLSYPGVFISPGPGLYAVLVGGVVTVVGSLMVSRP